MRIALDLDNTIINTPKIIFNLHNKLSSYKINYADNIDLQWDFKPLVNTKEELTELFELFDDPEFYDDVIAFDNAIEIINQLSMKNEVVIISKHMDSRKPLTSKWVSKTFSTVNLIFVDNFEDKGKILNGFDIILDDRLDAIESCKGLVKYCIVYGDYHWNREYQGLRANNWLEFKQFVDNLSKLDKQ